MTKLMLALCLGPLLLTGCSTTFKLTNLTPTTQPRNEDNLYRVELQVDSNQHALRWDSIRPYVVMGFDFYPMVKTPLVKNRWETLIPIPVEDAFVHYKFKVDYDYNKMGARGQASKNSTEYKLNVKD